MGKLTQKVLEKKWVWGRNASVDTSCLFGGPECGGGGEGPGFSGEISGEQFRGRRCVKRADGAATNGL